MATQRASIVGATTSLPYEESSAHFWRKLRLCLDEFFHRRSEYCSYVQMFHSTTDGKTAAQTSLIAQIVNTSGRSCVKLKALLQDDEGLYNWLTKPPFSTSLKERLEVIRSAGIIGDCSGQKTFARESIDVGDGFATIPDEWCTAPGPVTRRALSAAAGSSAAPAAPASSSSSSSSEAPTLEVALKVVFKEIDRESNRNTAKGPKNPPAAQSVSSGLPLSCRERLTPHTSALRASLPPRGISEERPPPKPPP